MQGQGGGGKPSGYSREPPDRSAEILKRPAKHKGGFNISILKLRLPPETLQTLGQDQTLSVG